MINRNLKKWKNPLKERVKMNRLFAVQMARNTANKNSECPWNILEKGKQIMEIDTYFCNYTIVN